MNKLSGWHRLLIFIAILWGITIFAFSWLIYENKKYEIYGHWYTDFYTKLNNESYSWINNPDLSIPQLINMMKKELDKNDGLCDKKTNSFCNVPSNTDLIKNKYQNELNHIFTLSFVGRSLLLWAIPILLMYLFIISLIWIYDGFKTRD